MGYSESPEMVRVDFFKSSGKYYTTEAVKWTGQWKGNLEKGGQMIHEAFAESLRDHLGTRLREMDAVCLHPYHEYEHPLCIREGGWLK
jgi:hypothetical protein